MKKIGILIGEGISSTGKLPAASITRVKKAYQLLNKNKIQKLILSGGYTSEKFPKISEADLFFKFLTKKSINKKQLIMEKNSIETIGNAVYSKKIILKQKLPKKIALITSNYHMKKALMVFNHIFEKKYKFTPNKSYLVSSHTIFEIVKEIGNRKITKLALTQVPLGNHQKAERLLKQFKMYK